MNTATSAVPALESRLREGRDAGGRFAFANRGGPGNPFAREVAAFRAMIYRVVTPEDIQQAICTLVELAREGHFGALKLLLSYTLGKPTAAVEVTFDDRPAEPIAPPSTNGSAQPKSDAAAPSANGSAPSGAEPPSTNDGRPGVSKPPSASIGETPSTNSPAPAAAAGTKPPPSTNAFQPPGGGKRHNKRLLTACLRGKV